MPIGPFLDSANAAAPAWNDGNALPLDTGVKMFGASSFRFPNATYQNVRVPNYAGRFALAGDFTLEFWTRPQTNLQQGIYAFGDNDSTNAKPSIRRGNGAFFVVTDNTGTVRITGGAAAANAWYHLALTRSGSTMTLWMGGVSQGSYTNAATLSTQDHWMGCIGSGNGGLYLGHIDDVRFTAGVCRYTGTFTPPAAAFPDDIGGDPDWASVVSLLHGDAVHAPAPEVFDAVPSKELFAPTWPGPKTLLDGLVVPRKWDYGGFGKIAGTLKINGTPDYAVRREVCLIRERDMVCVAAQWSDPITGAYEFLGFDPNERYTVLAYDYTHAFRAVVGDNIIPEAM